MLLIEHKALHLYREDAYREYSYSVDQGAYQPASFILLCFEEFRNLCMQYGLQLFDSSSRCTQAKLEKVKISHPYTCFGLITRIENEQDLTDVQKALAKGKNVIALFPAALIDLYYWNDKHRYQEALQAFSTLGINNLDAYYNQENTIWWDERVTDNSGRLFIAIDAFLSDNYFGDDAITLRSPDRTKENQGQIASLLQQFSQFKHPLIRVEIRPEIPIWLCHEPLHFVFEIINHGPTLKGVEIAINLPEPFEPIGPIERSISCFKSLAKTSFALSCIPRSDGKFQNAVTISMSSETQKSISLGLPSIDIEIMPSSGMALYSQTKQDSLGLAALLATFKQLPYFPEIKRLPPLVQIDPRACLNQMRIIAEKLAFLILQKNSIMSVRDFNSAIDLLRRHKIVSLRSIGYFHTVRAIGNLGSHPYSEPLSEKDVRIVAYALASIAEEIVIKKLI